MPKQLDIDARYSTLSANITRFSELNQLSPRTYRLYLLIFLVLMIKETYGIESTFKECARGAKWHKSCHTKFNVTKPRKAEKRQLPPEDCSLKILID